MKLILTILVFLGLKVYEIGKFLLTWGLILSLLYTLPHIGHMLKPMDNIVIYSHLIWGLYIFLFPIIAFLILFAIWVESEYDIKHWLSSNWEKAERITGRRK
jgi:hypothetical protein